MPITVKLPAQNQRDLKNRPVSVPLNADEKTIKNPFIIPGLKKLDIDPRLNPENSFTNFVEGECNRLARSAGIAVANNPGGTAFNPLLSLWRLGSW
jgi:chromosomal replication initiator protein